MITLTLTLVAVQAFGSIGTPADRVACDQNSIPRGPCSNLQVVFARAHYPGEAWRLRQQGVVRFRVRVDRYGNVVDCWIVRSSGSPSLDQYTCLVLRRAVVYHPARDANGRAIAAIDEGSVRWTHPRPRGSAP